MSVRARRNPLASRVVGGCAYHQSWRPKLGCWLGSAKPGPAHCAGNNCAGNSCGSRYRCSDRVPDSSPPSGGVRTAGVVWRQRSVAATPCGRQCRVVASTERSVIVSKYRGSPWIVLIVMSLGFFMTLLDLTIVNIAIPDMITRLHATLDGVLWVINAYALVLAVLLITAGRLGDLFGQRRMCIVGVILFTLASAACGFSPSVGWLVAFRAIQGVGAALLLPQTLAILTTVFPPERRGAAFGIWGGVAGVATIAGPTLGGLLVSAFDWRYIFFCDVPSGGLVVLIDFFLIPHVRVGARHPLSIPGALLAA